MKRVLPQTNHEIRRNTERMTRHPIPGDQSEASNQRQFSGNLPGHPVETCLGRAALKAHALQTLARDPLTRPGAKRLECVRFIGAFPPARDGQRMESPNREQNERGPA